MNDPLDNYFESLCGGLPLNELVSVIYPSGEVGLVALMVDVEADPVRFGFDDDRGDAVIHADGQHWHMLSADQLRTVASWCERAERIWETWHDLTGSHDDRSESYLRAWLAMGDSGKDLRPKGGAH